MNPRAAFDRQDRQLRSILRDVRASDTRIAEALARERIARRDHTVVAIVACVLAIVFARLNAPEWLPLLLIGIGIGAALRFAITAESEHADG